MGPLSRPLYFKFIQNMYNKKATRALFKKMILVMVTKK
jgi:hypothetical protein